MNFNLFANEPQILLLKACLLEGRSAVSAWKVWKEQVDIDFIDSETFSLLPLLYLKLQENSITDPMIPRLKGVYKVTWYKNNLVLNSGLKVFESFKAVGISSLVLKGGALCTRYYADYGARPMNDLDLLVSPDQITHAIQVLSSFGFSCSNETFRNRTISSGSVSQEFIETHHALPFINDQAQKIDLHWYSMRDFISAGSDEGLWNRSVEFPFKNMSIRTLNDMDMFIQVCMTGYRGLYRFPQFRWVADAYMIRRFCNGYLNIEDKCFLEEIAKRNIEKQMSEMMFFLREEFDFFSNSNKNFYLLEKKRSLYGTKLYVQLMRYLKKNESKQLALMFFIIFLNIQMYHRYQMARKRGFFSYINPLTFIDYLKSRLGFSHRLDVLRLIFRRLKLQVS